MIVTLFAVPGLWDNAPKGWDHRVPFVDPNNKGKKGKPCQEVLETMFEYLLKCYYQVSTRFVFYPVVVGTH